MVLQIPSSSKAPTVTWEALPADFVLPDDPLDNIQQPPLAAALTDALGAAGRIGPIALIGSNFGLVATVNKQIVVKAPDWFYAPQVHRVAEDTIRRSYTPNLEGAPVSVVMEFLSNRLLAKVLSIKFSDGLSGPSHKRKNFLWDGPESPSQLFLQEV
ncbi:MULTISPECIES: hypothetical protein [unclassified Microcoleus]|uniref:hypothetical protein n=1 Tax=unclassified Microcoleus TaxID=2642155 RepID=UPI002FD3EB98